jgi:hypothetical protein
LTFRGFADGDTGQHGLCRQESAVSQKMPPQSLASPPILPGRTAIKVPAGYPADLYWKGQPPKEEYNYLRVDVQPGQKTKFTLNRFRPWSAEPFAAVEVFK